MNFPRNIFGPTQDPFPGEDIKAAANATSQSAKVVIMGEHYCFFFMLHLNFSLLTIYCRWSIPDATRKDIWRAGSQSRSLSCCPSQRNTCFGEDDVDIRRPSPLADDARDYIFRLTNGHPGAVSGFVEALTKVCCIVYFWIGSRSLSNVFQLYHAEIKYQKVIVGFNHVELALND